MARSRPAERAAPSELRRGRLCRVRSAALAVLLGNLLAVGTLAALGAGSVGAVGPRTTPERSSIDSVMSVLNPAQDDGTSRSGVLRIGSVSPWVEPEGTFEVAFEPAPSVPLDSTFSYTIHQRLRPQDGESLRERTEAVLDGDDPGGILQATVETPAISLGDPVEGMVLRVPLAESRGGGGRILVPTAGVHPVTLALTASDGTELWSSTVFLNRLPSEAVEDPAGAPGRMSVTLVVPVDGPPSLAPDGTPQLDAETRAEAAAAAGLLSQLPEAPLVLALRPNTLTGLVAAATGTDELFLRALRSTALRASIARRTDVEVDTGGLIASDAADELLRQLGLGEEVVREATGKVPETGTWLLDDTVSPQALPIMAGLGTRRVIVSGDRLRLPSGVSEETARTRAMALQGAPELTVLADDPTLTVRLAGTGSDPALRANQVTTALMASWFAAAEEGSDAFPGPSAVAIVPATTDPAVIRAMLPALSGDGPLTADPGSVPRQPAEVDGEVITAELAPRQPTDQAAPVAESRRTRQLIESFSGMTAAADPQIRSWELLNSETLSTQMDPSRRGATHAGIRAQIDQRLRAVVLPPERRVVLTTRDATVPLRFRNDLPYPVTVQVRLRSSRLEIEQGAARELVLQPGENRFDLEVTVQAPGATILRIGVTSPDGRLVVGDAALPITSSRISGVGAALSVASLLVLAGWWVTTWRRDRRRARVGRRVPPRAGR